MYGTEQVIENETTPRATFFAELPPERVDPRKRGEALQRLWGQKVVEDDPDSPILVEYLSDHKFGIALALNSIDEPTAEAIRILNNHDVPVTAWVVLNQQHGYFLNRASASEVQQTTQRLLTFRDHFGLRFDGIGFDIEKPLYYLAAFNQLAVTPGIRTISHMLQAARAYRYAQMQEMQSCGDPRWTMNSFLPKLRSEGLRTEAYVMPRFTGRLLGGGMDLDVERTVQMLYTSPLPIPPLLMPFALRMLRDPRTIPAAGIVTGIEGETPGVELTPGVPTKHLTEKTLERDLQILMSQGFIDQNGTKITLPEVYLFALNHAKVASMLYRARGNAEKRIYSGN